MFTSLQGPEEVTKSYKGPPSPMTTELCSDCCRWLGQIPTFGLMVAPPLDYALYCKDNRRRLWNLKFLVKIDKSIRAVTINCDFSLPRLTSLSKLLLQLCTYKTAHEMCMTASQFAFVRDKHDAAWDVQSISCLSGCLRMRKGARNMRMEKWWICFWLYACIVELSA